MLDRTTECRHKTYNHGNLASLRQHRLFGGGMLIKMPMQRLQNGHVQECYVNPSTKRKLQSIMIKH